MDPQVGWNELLDAAAAGDLFEASLRAEGLIEWLGQGGFPPQTVSRILPCEWDRIICLNLCRQVMIAVRISGE